VGHRRGHRRRLGPGASSECPARAVYAARPEVQAVVHAHPRYSTALATTRRAIPPFHYMVAVAGGRDIRCAAYATFGSEQLARNAVEALRDRKACLLANHGSLAVARACAARLTWWRRWSGWRPSTASAGHRRDRAHPDFEMARVLERSRATGSRRRSS